LSPICATIISITTGLFCPKEANEKRKMML
jgi:hypothetical protein